MRQFTCRAAIQTKFAASKFNKSYGTFKHSRTGARRKKPRAK